MARRKSRQNTAEVFHVANQRPVSFVAHLLATFAAAQGESSELRPDSARPAGLEPATPGLEDRFSRFPDSAVFGRF